MKPPTSGTVISYQEEEENISCICSGWYPKSRAFRSSVIPIPKHICSTRYFQRNFVKYAEEKYIDFAGNHRSASFQEHLFPAFKLKYTKYSTLKVLHFILQIWNIKYN